MKINLFGKIATNATARSHHEGTHTHFEQELNLNYSNGASTVSQFLTTEDSDNLLNEAHFDQLISKMDMFRQQLLLGELAYYPCPDLFLYRSSYLQ